MWLFADHGFTSTVAYDPAKDIRDTEHKKVALASDDPKGWLLIRARVENDLVEVEKALQRVKGDPEFTVYLDEDKTADYSFRALISRPDFKAYLADRVDDIDYGSHFKEVAEKRSSQGAARHSAMMSVWSAMARLQPHAPYGGWTGTTTKWTPKSTTVPVFQPSTMWLRQDDVREALTKAPLSEWTHDYVEAMDDDAFELYLAATKAFGTTGTALTADQVDDLVDTLLAETPAVH